MVDKVIEGFKRDFLAIKSRGFVPSSRKHDTGIGKTFEDLIGILENNNALADYKGLIELKSARELSGSRVTLFTKSPSSPKGVNAVLREKYGQPDKTSMKILHTTVSAVKFNTFAGKFGFKLDVDDAKNKIFLRVKDLQADKAEEMGIYYDFAQLKEKVENKCRYIAFITAQTKKEGGKEFFKFDNARILSGMTFEKFLNAIKAGLIVYDLRLGAYKSGKNKGKLHDHGSGFRILKNLMHDVFEVGEI